MAQSRIVLPTPTPSTAGEIQNGAYYVAGQAIDLAADFVNELYDLAKSDTLETSLELPEVEFLQNDGPVLNYLNAYLPLGPIPEPVEITLPDAPSPTFSTAPDITVPDFTTTAPSLNIPATPDSSIPEVPTAPTISDPVLPEAPIVALPTAPTFATVNLPLPPSVDIPSFLAGLPSEDFLTPTNNFTFYEEQYSSDLLDALNAKLLGDLQNGGYGIETADEEALFERARDRELESAMVALDDIRKSTAARGFPLPPGELFVAEQRAQQGLQNKMSDVNRDIAIKRADLFVENRRFAIEQSKSLEQIVIGFHNSVQERALNFAKASLEAAIQVYEAQLKRFSARLDAYRTEAQVFEAKVRAALTQVEIYKTQMEGSRLELESQKTQAELYRTQIGGIETVVNVYRARLEAAGVQANIERTRLESFRARIDAFQAQVQAKVAEFGMYEAQIRGETSKVQAYEVEARAHTARIEGTKVRSDIALGNLRQETESARAQIDVYRGKLQGAELDLKRQVDTVQSLTTVYQADIQRFAASSQALAEYLRLEQARGNTNKEMTIRAAGIQLDKIKLLLAQLELLVNTKIKASGTAGEYFKALVSAAMQQVNAVATKAG
jgi:hypothetical protein